MISRFNLSLLRQLGSSLKSEVPIPPISRRAFLGLTGASLAAAAVRNAGDFTIERAGQVLLIVTDRIVRWRIDPVCFGPAARVRVERDGERAEIRLSNAVFPGTSLPASFRCVLQRTLGRWSMSLRSASGLSIAADWLDWLEAREPATGTWDLGTVHPFPQFSLSARGRVPVAFTPDWRLQIESAVRVAVDGLEHELHAARSSIALDHGERLAGDPSGHTTTFSFLRGEIDWRILCERASNLGWSLAHELEANLFDEMRLEALDSGGVFAHNAVLTQAETNRQALLFYPGGGIFDSRDEPFALRLRSPRLAMALGGEKNESVLLADLTNEMQWAHMPALSVAFGHQSGTHQFMLFDQGSDNCCPQVTPPVQEIHCSADEDCTIKLKFDEPRPTPFNWAKFVQKPEDILSGFHLLGGEHRLSFDLSCGDVLSVLRPTDMLKLDFEFQNVRLVAGYFVSGPTPRIKGANAAEQKQKIPSTAPEVGETELLPAATSATSPGSTPHTCKTDGCLPSSRRGQDQAIQPNCPQLLCSPNGKPRVTVTFPPQHIQEQAFFHSDDPFDDHEVSTRPTGPTSQNPYPWPGRKRQVRSGPATIPRLP